jgi:hypothetical protein
VNKFWAETLALNPIGFYIRGYEPKFLFMAAPKKTTSAKKTVTKKASAAASPPSPWRNPRHPLPPPRIQHRHDQVVASNYVGFGNSLYIRGNGAGLAGNRAN